ncbi:uncharacterized protein DSM5745_05259 [Aspergillus mulundensis]|uniref:Myb-like domain-containing protein n=1 Tax=Aspergillus mulundensis TaxID=1810919 RepID=A0A3D8S5Y3_9EURO|nr:Uncharacterized protein DSM5745_05259 [Aspergillus mulundensis]RDW81702.1 Uncharacterized protein DSM5745_05259 [Aspergillus mulundensis]
MFRVLAGPDSWRKDMLTECNLLSTSCLAILPDSCAPMSSLSFDTTSTLSQRPETTMECDQLQVGEHVGADERCLITSNGVPNGDLSGQEVQTGREQYSHWHASFPIVEPAKTDRPTSQSSSHWRPQKIDHPSPGNPFALEEFSPNNASVPTPDLVHPIPRHSPYTVTSYFASENVPETLSSFGQTESPLSEDRKCLVRGSDRTSDDLVYFCLLQERQSPGTNSVTTMSDQYTPITNDGTFNNLPLSPWPSVKAQMPCDTQRSNAAQCRGEALWNDARLLGDIDQQQGHLDQFPVTSDVIHGLPSLGPNVETYVQPSSLLDPYDSTCSDLYLNGSTVTQQDHSHIQYSNNTFTYQNNLRPDDATDSFFPAGRFSYQPSHVGRMAPWTSDARNALLIEYKRRGLSYKDIKRIGGFKEAESTLRGRFRTLTKSKEQRVRKPQWHENDVSLWRCRGIGSHC